MDHSTVPTPSPNDATGGIASADSATADKNEPSPDGPPSTDPSLPPRIQVAAAMWVSAVVVVLLALYEVDRVIGGLLDTSHGRAYSPTDQTGPSTLTAVASPGRFIQGWEFLAQQGAHLNDRLPCWLVAYAVVDFVFIALYGSALWRAASSSVASSAEARVLIAIGVGADVVEGVLIFAVAGHVVPTVAAWTLFVVSIVKWVALLLAAISMTRNASDWLKDNFWPQALQVMRGLYTHRYSLLIALPLGVMSLAHGHDILEQVPDIERRWIDGDHWSGVFAAALAMLLAVATLLIGRLRTDDLVRRRSAVATTAPSLTLWYACPIGIAAVAVVTIALGGTIRWWALIVFGGVPLFVAVASTIVEWRGWEGGAPPTTPPSDDRVRVAWLVGDLVPGILIVAICASAVRSFTGYVMLHPESVPAWSLTSVGAALAVGFWPVYRKVLDRVDAVYEAPGNQTDAPPGATQAVESAARARAAGAKSRAPRARDLFRPGEGSDERSWVAPAVLVVGVGGYLAVGLQPTWVAHLGVLAAFQLAVGSLGIAVAAAVSINRRYGVPHVFWRLHLTVVPVTALTVATALLCAVLGGPRTHPIRAIEGAAKRPRIDQVFQSWLESTSGCDVESNGERIRPMLLYAAEGGGIRAAYWTAAAVDAIASTGGDTNCGRAFLSTGASGGSVGLTIASVSEPGEAATEVRAIADQSALGQAVIGLVSRDQLFAGTGIGLPLLGQSGDGWIDRAGLIERAWEDEINGLDASFFDAPPESSPVGTLVLNSTASNGCRALLSQLELAETATPGSCGTDGAPIAASIDVFRCTGHMSAVTAALLSARFPYVTPAGETTCADGDSATDDPVVKFVDGGYGENTGIVTQVDLITEWLPLVRRHNMEVGPDESIIVPLLVYFDNGTGSDLGDEPAAPPIEVLVPPLTKGAATSVLTSPESNLQRAAALLAPNELGLDAVSAAAVEKWRPQATAVVYTASRPAIAAPLGWVLSSKVMDEMDEALAATSTALPGHATLADVRAIVAASSSSAAST